MDMLEKHKEVLKKPIVYYHSFLNAYHKNRIDELFIVCEGDVDLSYYGEIVNHKYPHKHIIKRPVECKNNVIQLWKYIDWNIYEPKRVLFFVDRDFSYWADEPQYYASNVYITDGYSFENDAVNEHMFIKCLEDFYGFANWTQDEEKTIRELYIKCWESFKEGSYELMAYAFYHYKRTGLHKASNVKLKKCLSFEQEELWKKTIDNYGRSEYFRAKLEIGDSVDENIISDIIQKFYQDSKHYSIRGKWSLDFMVMLLEYVMDCAKTYVPSLFDGCKKVPQRLVNLPERGAMSIIGPKIIPPESLVAFIDNNLC